MSNASAPDPISQRVLVLRIMAGALIAGGLGTLAFLAYARTTENKPLIEPLDGVTNSTLTYVALGAAVALLLAFWIVPAVVVGMRLGALQRAGKQPTADTWYGLYMMQTILALALLEGAALTAAIAYFYEGTITTLGASLAALIFLAVQLPSRGKMDAWLQRQQELERQDRQRNA